MRVHEPVHVGQFPARHIVIAIARLIFAPVKALLLTHESIGILAELFTNFRMLLQELLQVTVSFNKFLIVHERRIFSEPFGDFRMSVQKIVETGKLSPGRAFVPVLCEWRRSLRLRQSGGWRNYADETSTHQQNKTAMGKIISGFHKLRTS